MATKQVTLRVTFRQYAAYKQTADRLKWALHEWALDTLEVGVGFIEPNDIEIRAPRLSKAAKKDADFTDKNKKQFNIRMSQELWDHVCIAAKASTVSPTTWCMHMLDAASGASHLGDYLARVRIVE